MRSPKAHDLLWILIQPRPEAGGHLRRLAPLQEDYPARQAAIVKSRFSMASGRDGRGRAFCGSAKQKRLLAEQSPRGESFTLQAQDQWILILDLTAAQERLRGRTKRLIGREIETTL